MYLLALQHKLHFRWIVHAHAAVYVGWLLLLGVQVGLMRTGRRRLHMRLGAVALILIPLMAILGPAVALTANTANPAPPDEQLAFMSTQFTNVLCMTVLLVAGLLARRHPAAHKRLMLMGAVAITEPGFSRLPSYYWLYDRLGDGFFQYLVWDYGPTILLALAVGAYDLWTRGRLHPAYVAAALWIFANEMVAAWLYYQPFWLGWMKALTGH